MEQHYVQSVRLLLTALPNVFASDSLALKGGTAINLFLSDMPRLSVDIDVVYLPTSKTRAEALADITSELTRMSVSLARLGLKTARTSSRSGDDCVIFISNEETQIKVEINTVLRGSLLPPVTTPTHQIVSEIFGIEISVPLLNTTEIYAGKIMAALDRQHPRDLFDVWHMYERRGIDQPIVDAFIIYLISHNRPPHEVLNPNDKPINALYRDALEGMIRTEIPTLKTLEHIRRQLKQDVIGHLTEKHRKFLNGFFAGTSIWDLLPFQNVDRLPAIRWKIENLDRLRSQSLSKYREQSRKLASILNIDPLI
jgi:predicted nucleotidyltransferase component of viral defense system